MVNALTPLSEIEYMDNTVAFLRYQTGFGEYSYLKFIILFHLIFFVLTAITILPCYVLHGFFIYALTKTQQKNQ